MLLAKRYQLSICAPSHGMAAVSFCGIAIADRGRGGSDERCTVDRRVDDHGRPAISGAEGLADEGCSSVRSDPSTFDSEPWRFAVPKRFVPIFTKRVVR